MLRILYIVIFLSCAFNIVNAQEKNLQKKITVHCKINFYKEQLFDMLNKLNIVFEPVVRFAEFDDKTKIQKLKYFEALITTEKLLKHMRFLGWHLADSTETKNLGYTFYFQKILNKSSIDFIPKLQLKPLS